MVLQLFINVINLTDSMTPVMQGIGATNVVWMTARARTNGFIMGTNIYAIDGFTVAQGGSLDIPITDMVGKTGIWSLEDTYWKNAVAGSQCTIEVIGMRLI